MKNGSLNLGQKTKLYNNQQKKRTFKIVDFAVLADHKVKWKESEKKVLVSRPCYEIAETVERKSYVYKKCNSCSWYSHKRIIKGTGGLENKRPSGNHSKYSSIETDQYTEKSPGDLKRLVVTQTPVKDHQRTLM